jgi:hypothetical protein
MKKLAAAISSLAYLTVNSVALASHEIRVNQPRVGYGDISTFINAAIRLAFIIALLAVLVMLVWGALQWIFSGGDKEGVGKARGRILHALIGLAILAVAFALVTLAGSFVGIDLLGQVTVPSPGNPEPAIPTPTAHGSPR